MTELNIKNMVCDRCIHVVKGELKKIGYETADVSLGYVKIDQNLNKESREKIGNLLSSFGFELLDSDKAKMIERIKNLVIMRIHHTDELDLKVNWSTLLSAELNHDYSFISSLFSSVEGITLEQYIIRQKIERVKELLFYDELSLKEIAYKLDYSSVQHLSTQFKKITGQTPTDFKMKRAERLPRQAIDQI
ncbi:helix-turn-helix domain-containing protein [Sphingobacterium spiritivorum]|uniref:helix-turn-helix domain-containing protein n=1 Tax=Sphingobacterium spiritivorum TaxID=258 RepID=UPI003DA299D0